jgi:hypothetical protein
MFYSTLYHTICEKSKANKELWKDRTNELHRHHIIPTHVGGPHTDDNFTYITVREHIIAHFLLWKMHGNVNDLRSMHMLGGKLTRKQRQIVGKWCAENGIGFHTPKHRRAGALASKEVQRKAYLETGDKNWFYWSTDDGRKERASIGGKASWEHQKNTRNGLPFFLSEDPEVRKLNAKKANAAQPKKQVTNGVRTIKLHTDEDVHRFLLQNPEFRRGCHYGGFPKTKGRIVMNRDGVNRMFVKEDVNDRLLDGWVIGKLKKQPSFVS